MKAKRSISLLLAIVMLVSSVIASMLAVGVTAAETDPKKIEKLIVDMRSEAAMMVNAEIYKHTPTEVEPWPNLGGVYEFDTEKNACRLIYDECSAHPTYRLMTRVSQLTEEFKYWVIVYQAKTTSSYNLYLHNSPSKGVRVNVTDNGADTNGKWVVSEPQDISLEANGTSILKRWIGKGLNNIYFKTDDKNAEFYIKEMGFFKSPEDAKAYYAGVDLEKSPSEYSDAAPTSGTSVESKDTYLIKYEIAPEPSTGKTEEAPTESTVEPVVWKFTNNKEMIESGARLTTHEGFTAGLQAFKTLDDGTKAMQLQYSAYGNWKPYRAMPAMTQTTQNKITAEHKYMRITYMTTDLMGYQILLSNNASGRSIAIVDNTRESQGKFVTSNAVNIDVEGLLERFVRGAHCTIMYTGSSKDCLIYISEIAFFGSEAQAYEYYGDSAKASAGRYYAMTFGSGATGTFTLGETYGNVTVDNARGVLVVDYADKTNSGQAKYMAKVKFTSKGYYDSSYKYMRIAYSATVPDGVTGGIYMYNDKMGEIVQLEDRLVDTNGEYVLGDAVRLFDDTTDRFAGANNYSNTMHNSIITNILSKDAQLVIKGIYFFQDRETAENFEIPRNDYEISINGNDISKYQIVITDDAPIKLREAAEVIVNRVLQLTGHELPIVEDTAAKTDYEILIGPSDREESTAQNEVFAKYMDSEGCYWSYVKGNTLVITSFIPANTKVAANTFTKAFLYDGVSSIPDKTDLTEANKFDGIDTTVKLTDFWEPYENVEDPDVFIEDFDVDEGYFNEENGQTNWYYQNGRMYTEAKSDSLAYIHVYEADATYEATLNFANGSKTADFGLMLRYNSQYAWVKAGYSFATGEWFISDREGADFFEFTRASKKAELKSNTDYKLKFTVDGNSAKLYVNGELILETDGITHTSPGRVALFSDFAKISIDDVKLTLLSGLGTVWANVAHTKLPDEVYREGGSVFEMNDGTLIYQHHSTVAFESKDNGVTWVSRDKWTDTYGYVNILRLNNGDWLKIATVGGYKISQTSSDDGKTWVNGGNICVTPFRNDTTLNAGAGNMNDKIFQSATTNRIFYSQNYEVFGKGTFDGRTVFCEFFYSDDNGKTWTKSETDSWELGGNEDVARFGECKFLECADGTIRMYNSWNMYDCIVYSDSTDGGKTFGPLKKMEDFVCSCSSMQFVRDVYADNATTYYMVWVNSEPISPASGMSRAGLTLAKSTDGKNWTVLGDVWRWENNYTNNGAFINHVVDPFIKTTEDYILVGSGFSEHMGLEGESDTSKWHQAQRQHIYSIPKESVEPAEQLYKFKDVDTKDSFYEAVKYAVDNGLFNGTSETTFEPYTTMNRAMFVTVLGRLEGAQVDNNTATEFTDVKVGEWYTGSVAWAAKNGIVNGMGNGIYGVTGTITVEQACTILYRYNGGKTSDKLDGAKVTDFTDNASVSAWAADGVKWAVENGIYQGQGDILAPTSAASRALVATMFANYVKAFG